MQNTNLKSVLIENNLDTLFVTNPVNIFYLTGFKGISPTEREALLFIRKGKSTLITAKLYQKEASLVASQDIDVKIAAERNEYESFIKNALSKTKRLGFESHDLKYAEFKSFKKFQNKMKMVPTKHRIEELRIVKSNEEIQNIHKAQLITQKAFFIVLKTIKIGQTEVEIAKKLQKIVEDLAPNGISFDPIVASGPNSAVPHHVAGQRKLRPGDTLLFDFGAKYKNYCADFTRTVFVGRADDTQRNTYDLVYKSQQTALNKIKPGVKAKKVFEAAHDIFKKEKLDGHFIHSLGHGIGLEVHEKPSISNKSKDILSSGMVFSIEPGLYFPWGGVRIEDLVAISDKATLLAKPSLFIEL